MRKWNQVGPIAHAVLVTLFALVSLSALLPLIFVAIVSLSSTESIAVKGYSFFPMEWSLEAYRYMWTRIEYIGHSFLISCLITVVGTILSTTQTVDVYIYKALMDQANYGLIDDLDRKSTRLNSSHPTTSRMPSSA